MGFSIIRLTKPTPISFVTENNKGMFPKYASKKSTEQGTVRCACNTCVGNLIYFKGTDEVIGWFEKKCSVCGEEINWSQAGSYL